MHYRIAIVLLWLMPSPALAQPISAPFQSLHRIGLLMVAGDEARRDLRPLDALASFEEVLEEVPTHYGALWRAARECVSLSTLAESDGERRRWSQRAEDFAARAGAENPQGPEANFWLAVALGQQAEWVGPRDKISLAQRIRDRTLAVLEEAPDDAGAHHVLGEWHAEIRRLSGLTRWAARKLLGADVFDVASWERAEHHLARAVEVDPSQPSHRLALGRLLLDLDRREEGLGHLEQALTLPVLAPEGDLIREEARSLLGEEFSALSLSDAR